MDYQNPKSTLIAAPSWTMTLKAISLKIKPSAMIKMCGSQSPNSTAMELLFTYLGFSVLMLSQSVLIRCVMTMSVPFARAITGMSDECQDKQETLRILY